MSKEHECCFHVVEEPTWIVLKPGHVLVECCICFKTKQVHKSHAPRDFKTHETKPGESYSWESHCKKYTLMYSDRVAY